MNIHGSDTDARQLPELSLATEKDLEVVREQLGRLPRGVDSICLLYTSPSPRDS